MTTVTVSIDLSLEESPGGSISGSGYLDFGILGNDAGPVVGTHLHSDVTLVAGNVPLQAHFSAAPSGEDTVREPASVRAVPDFSLPIHGQ